MILVSLRATSVLEKTLGATRVIMDLSYLELVAITISHGLVVAVGIEAISFGIQLGCVLLLV